MAKATSLSSCKLLLVAHIQFLMKHLIQVINRAKFGQYINKRYLAHTIERLELLTLAGNAQAMYQLGMLYWDGHGTSQNQERALELLRAAAKGGVLYAAYNLAVAYDNGYHVAKSHYKALGYYLQAARLGYAEAMHAVGSFYYWGQGVTQDYAKARYWYRKSANLGCADGMCDLARCYQIRGSQQNEPLAIHWLRKAVSAGCLRAQTWLGLAYACEGQEDWSQARYWLEQAAENQQAHAMYALGLWAENGWNNEENLADAAFWFRHAASLGHERAMLHLAELQGEVF
jgi:TPR repeat protein